MHNYFIGITLPADFTNKIIDVQCKLFDEKILIKPLLPHITVLHPNLLTKISPMILVPKIREITKDLDLNINLLDFNVFNNSVLYISAESPELEYLYNSLLNLLPKDVLAKYFVGRNFIPHVTVAQTKPKIKLSADLINLYKINLKNELPFSFKIDSLYKFNRQYSRTYSASKISFSSK